MSTIDNIDVSYSNNGNIEIATVTDLDTGEIVETIELIPNSLPRNATRSTFSHTLRRTFTVARTTLQLDIQIELYKWLIQTN